MAETPKEHEAGNPQFEIQIGRRAERKLRARKEKHHTGWFGLSIFGLVGWSVAVPALMGIALGLWLDRR